MRRIRVTLAYEGTDFHGWQVQPGLSTIQGVLQNALEELEKAPVIVAGSGRTDAGVHALGQVAAFSMENPIPAENLKRALNQILPGEIRILSAEDCAPEFHPRFDAVSKTYEYRVWRGEICSPFEQRYVHHHPYPLDVSRMIEMAPLLEGEHDFSAFAASDDRDALGYSKVRRIFSSRLASEGERLTYRVSGSGFLKHMVRNIMGMLIEVGKGNLDASGVAGLLQEGCVEKAGPRAPACGLFLVKVEYR
jgi:tRNA pseudouridine38-40 synthase